jgi:signal transduction histidine kinase
MIATHTHIVRAVQFIILVWVLAVALILLVANPLLNPPPDEARHLLLLMGVSGSVSIIVACIIYKSGLVARLFSLRAAFLLVTLLSMGLVFLNIWFLAWEMFIEYHDLNLNTVLLLFAGGTAVGCVYFIAHALTERITVLMRGAESLAAGDLSTRVSVRGNDELAALAVAFNTMSARMQEAADQKAMLEQARRDLIAWASHDLRTPLASLRLVVDALADGMVEDDETRQRYLATAQKEIANLNDLINDLFELSQLDTGHIDLRREHTSLSDLLSDTLSALRALAERRGVQLEGEVSPAIDPVEIDAEKIQRVLYNLITNAIRHTPAGGQVMVTAELVGDVVRVTVRDSGEGIQSEDLPHIFERFYRGGRARTRDRDGQRGAGLGLAIARGLVEAHDGSIAVESAPGRGAAFTVTLPRRARA